MSRERRAVVAYMAVLCTLLTVLSCAIALGW